jgi:hypothetical protein
MRMRNHHHWLVHRELRPRRSDIRIREHVRRFEADVWISRAAAMALAAAIVLGIVACGRSSPTSPGGNLDVTGAWSGTSSYINAPFTMNLRHSGTAVTGEYRDRRDVGTVSGNVSGSTITLDVNFGDTGLRFTGTLPSRDRITGEILVPALGGRRFSFEMTR